jgi:hypothetical protein
MVGTVYNFDWKANNDGSYNCSIKLMGPGGMLESLKINSSINIDFDAKNDRYIRKIFFYFRKCFIFNEAIFQKEKIYLNRKKIIKTLKLPLEK